MVIAGRVGYVAKGVALAILGGLVIAAVVTADPEKAGGLDAALRTVGEQPFGQVLLVLTAAPRSEAESRLALLAVIGSEDPLTAEREALGTPRS